ncbi:MAG TPA: hypothetical protein VG842_10325, partial [Sediminibacterium sp.]|nr:hypothetical protein [Sediminibacterium sp.]
MKGQYNQFRAMLAITRGSLKAVFRSPSAVVFSIAFPMIFILVFGFIGSGGRVSVNIAFDPHTDTTNPVYAAIRKVSGISVVHKTPEELREDLEKGRITAMVNIQPTGQQASPYQVDLLSSEAVNPQNVQVLQSILHAIIAGINQRTYSGTPTIATVNNTVRKIPGRIYR